MAEEDRWVGCDMNASRQLTIPPQSAFPPPLPSVSSLRPAAWGEHDASAPAAPRPPLRPIEWAFLASVALAAAGTAIALGGLASAQALCNQGGQQGNFMVRIRGGG